MLKLFIDQSYDSFYFYNDEMMTDLAYSYKLKSGFFTKIIGTFTDKNNSVLIILTSNATIREFDDSLNLKIGNRNNKFERIDILRHHVKTIIDDCQYDFFKTTKGRYSIFKNQHQIAGLIEYQSDLSKKRMYVFKTEEEENLLIQIGLFLSFSLDKPYDDAFNSLNSLFFDTPYVEKADEDWFAKRFTRIVIPRPKRKR